MTDNPDSAHDVEMHQQMLVCCGTMTVIVGALAIRSVATTIGLSTGQTYFAISGFVLAVGTVILHRYRKQTHGDTRSHPTDGGRNDPPLMSGLTLLRRWLQYHDGISGEFRGESPLPETTGSSVFAGSNPEYQREPGHYVRIIKNP